MADLLELIMDRLPDEQVTGVRMTVGRQSGVSAEALRFAFDVCVAGTYLEGAALVIQTTDGAELRLDHVEVEERSHV